MNKNNFAREYEKNTKPSVTVPDQAMSVKEILRRYANGLPLSQSNDLVYTGDDYTPDLRTMDLVDIERLQAQNLRDIREMEKELADATAADQAAKTEIAFRKKFEAEQASKNDAPAS